MIAIADYGVGNIFSLCRSFEAIGADARLTDDPAVLRRADRLVLPGVELSVMPPLSLRRRASDRP